jgi:vacuolar-type H+-ATPase subunit E/Vma4
MAALKTFEQARLDRIESKIDKLAETVIQMARVEEKLVTMEADKKIVMEKLLRMDDRLETFDRKFNETAITVKVITRLFWIVITSAAGAITGFFFLK